MKKLTCLVMFLLMLGQFAHAQILKEKVTIGRVEWIELPDLKLKFRARIDTGAKTTSLHASNIEEIQQQGELFVRFKTHDGQGNPIVLTRKVESTAKVINPSGSTTKRYVIREKVKLGPVIHSLTINLNDRGGMDYKFLVGRNLLLGRFIVDVARSHVLGD